MIVININEVANNVTPPRLRSHEIMALMESISKPNVDVMDKFLSEAATSKYQMAFTGQVCYLRHLLNDKFDPLRRRIWIGNYSISTRRYLFNKSEENEETYLFNKSEGIPLLIYLQNETEYYYSFIIHVPLGIIVNWNEFKAWVERYKLKSKKYIIQEY